MLPLPPSCPARDHSGQTGRDDRSRAWLGTGHRATHFRRMSHLSPLSLRRKYPLRLSSPRAYSGCANGAARLRALSQPVRLTEPWASRVRKDARPEHLSSRLMRSSKRSSAVCGRPRSSPQASAPATGLLRGCSIAEAAGLSFTENNPAVLPATKLTPGSATFVPPLPSRVPPSASPPAASCRSYRAASLSPEASQN